MKKPTKNPHFSKPEKYKTDASYHSSKQSLQSDWIPLDIDPVAEHYRNSPVKSRQRKPDIFPNNIPVTTYSDTNKFPIIQYEPSAIYPLTMFSDNQNNFHNLHYLNDLNNPNIKQNVIDLSQLTVVPAAQHMTTDIITAENMQNNEDRLKNHRLSYEVNEPSSSEGGDMMVSDKTDKEESKERQHKKRERKAKSQNGQRNGYRRGRSGRSSIHNKEKTKPH